MARSKTGADGWGFEPPVPFGTHAFQACTINRSVTHPFKFLLVLVIVIVLGWTTIMSTNKTYNSNRRNNSSSGNWMPT